MNLTNIILFAEEGDGGSQTGVAPCKKYKFTLVLFDRYMVFTVKIAWSL